MLPPLNALRAFEAVARCKSFRGAAAELSITTSAVSHQIRKLEDFVGVALLNRNSKELSLTEEGASLFGYLVPAFAMIRQGAADLRARSAASPLGISLRAHFATQWLAPRLSRLWASLPDLSLRFYHSNGPADFTDPGVHISIEWLHETEVGEDHTLLAPGDLTPACGPALLAAGPDLRQPADLRHHKLLHEADDESWRAWLAAAGVAELTAAGSLFFEDTNVRQAAAAAGEGLALVCPALVQDDLRAGRLICPFPEVLLKSYGYYLVVPPSRLRIPAVKKCAAWFRREAKQSQQG